MVILTAFAQLIALNAKTGLPVASFGSNGRVDLAQGLRRTVDRRNYTMSSPPVIVRDVIEFTPSENDFPHLGAQVAFKRPAAGNVPAAVSLPDPVSDGPYTTPGQNGGFLGATYAPFRIDGDPNKAGFSVDGLEAGPELRAPRLAGRQALLRNVNARLGRLADDDCRCGPRARAAAGARRPRRCASNR